MSLSSLRHRSDRPILPMPLAGRQRAASAVDLDDDRAFRAEVLDPVDAVRHRDAWLDLQSRALEANPFLDPDVLLAAAQHLRIARRPQVLLVWDRGPATCRLIAVHALSRPRARRRCLVRAWTHDLVPIGVPLLDRERHAEAAAALVGWASAAGGAGLVFTGLASAGPVSAALARAARDRALPFETLATWRRAALWQGPTGAPAGLAALSAKAAKEARRQRRRLAERGALGFASARSGHDLREAVEQFLALEALGWKGAAGTAMLMHPGLTAFTRTTTRLLGPRDRCRVDSLTLDGAPIAMGIVLTHGDTDFLWKITYDERLGRLSPGVQFVLELTDRQGREGRAAVTDSCAIPDHPMIDRLWRERLDLADLAIGSGPGFTAALARLRLARHLRGLAKRVKAAWRHRRNAMAH